MTRQALNEEYKTREDIMLRAHKDGDKTLVGAQLKWIRDNRKQVSLLDGYANIYDYAMDMLGIKRTPVCTLICVAETFGEKDDDGNLTGVLKVKYRNYDFYKLDVMRTLDAKQLKSITPDMSVREIKAIARPAKPVLVREKTVPEQIAETAALLDEEDQARLLRIAAALMECKTKAA